MITDRISEARGVMVNTLDSGIVVSEFEFQWCNCVQFRTDTHGKSMDTLDPLAMG